MRRRDMGEFYNETKSDKIAKFRVFRNYSQQPLAAEIAEFSERAFLKSFCTRMTPISRTKTEKPLKKSVYFRAIRRIHVLKKQSLKKIPFNPQRK